MAQTRCFRCGYPYCSDRPGSVCRNCGAKTGLGDCFITTATCQTLDKPDDCEELTTLRHFRDTFMRKSTDMKIEVEKYYQIAPRIVAAIETTPDKGASEYKRIWMEYLQPAVAAVKSQRNEEAHDIYKNMVLELEGKYL